MKRVLAFGATGFLGRYLCAKLIKDGWRLRLVGRDPVRAARATVGAEVGQCQHLKLDVFDRELFAQALPLITRDVDAVIYGAARFHQSASKPYRTVHVDAPRELAEAAAANGVPKMILMSGLGLENCDTPFARSRIEAEGHVLGKLDGTHVVRPALIFGRGDALLMRFGAYAAMAPFFVIPHKDAPCRPVYAGDVADTIAELLKRDGHGVVEAFGPERFSLAGALQETVAAVGYERKVYSMPEFFARPLAALMETLLPNPPLTREMLTLIKSAGVPGNDKKNQTMESLGISATPIRAIAERELRHLKKTAPKNLSVGALD